ncbi:hypothetical protein A8F55_26095 [Burkholderia cenocepacia]|nr:hypothetical protein A8F55_26095 [Burkholderia cenocepacia]
MNRLPFRLRLCATFSVLLALAAPPVHAGEIKILMRDMKHAMQGAMSSRTIPELRDGFIKALRGC